jgi:glycosyltransferase involved in cell wall biosynthesis
VSPEQKKTSIVGGGNLTPKLSLETRLPFSPPASEVSPDKKKILLISYYFPPSGGPGVQRPLKFTRQLVKEGWQPCILTVKEDADFSVRDESLVNLIPSAILVKRTGLFEPYALYRQVTGKPAGDFLDSAALTASEGRKKSLMERLSLFLRSWLFIPDARIGWLIPGVRAGLALIRKEKPSLIMTSAPPNTTHLIGLVLKRLTGLPWVADFRDPWFKYLVPQRAYRLPRKIDALLGRAVARQADRILAVCNGVERELIDHFGEGIRSKTEIISNGYSEENFAAVESKSRQCEKFLLTYVGSIFNRYDFRPLLAAIDELCEEDKTFQHALSLQIAGSIDTTVRSWFENARCFSCIEFLGYRNYFDALALMQQADVLLLYIMDTPQGRNIPTSKIFEYLGARRPILALSPKDSDAAQIIAEVQAGIVVPPHDKQAIKDALLELFSRWQMKSLLETSTENDRREMYEMGFLTRRLVMMFTEVLNEKAGKRSASTPISR